MAPLPPAPAWDLPAGIDPSSLIPGVRLLLEARDCADGLGRDAWDFAVELSQLRAAGLSHSALRVLLCRGYVRAAAEVSAPGGNGRRFRRLTGLTLPERACFVLTEEGEAGARRLAALAPPTPEPPAPARPGRRCRPRWDAALRELWFGGELVKRFGRPAPNQELILAAFQEEGWPARIDDPLPPARGIDPVRRLHDATSALNRGQLRPLLRFRRDGSGQGVRWEHRHPIATPTPPQRHPIACRQLGECSHNRTDCSLSCAPGRAGQPGAPALHGGSGARANRARGRTPWTAGTSPSGY